MTTPTEKPLVTFRYRILTSPRASSDWPGGTDGPKHPDDAPYALWSMWDDKPENYEHIAKEAIVDMACDAPWELNWPVHIALLDASGDTELARFTITMTVNPEYRIKEIDDA